MPTRNPETGNRSAVCFLAGYIVAAPEAGNQSQAGYNIRKPYNCASTSGDERIFCRRLSPWADPISNGIPSATTSIPTCIPCSGFAQQIGEGTQKAQSGAAKGTKNCLFCVPHCAFCGSSPFVGHGSLLHDLRQVGPNVAKA